MQNNDDKKVCVKTDEKCLFEKIKIVNRRGTSVANHMMNLSNHPFNI